ncbi:MAG TPA: RnfABCDGE type electron transport complex subunit D [Atribacteraceae bacterium]|nr:RnfABCDGE type electron transport complex subunit D [Atribacteraceae bacterium]
MEHRPRLVFSPAPHLKNPAQVPRIMGEVFIALLPAAAWAGYAFGFWNAFLPVFWSITAALAFEYLLCRLLRKSSSLGDGSALVTGMLLGLSLPPGSPFWLAMAGGAIAIVLGKQIFGGLGQNIFNPALVGRAVLLISWPRTMYTWVARVPFSLPDLASGINQPPAGMDVVTTATVLDLAELHGYAALRAAEPAILTRLFLGQVPGSIGEVSALFLLIGFCYLLWRGIVHWDIPLWFAVGLVVVILLGRQSPLFHLLSGGVVIGACFMATDYVTTPMAPRARLVFGLGAGMLTAIIRLLGAYPEGVTFGILMMNALVPLLDKMIPVRFGVKSR